MIRPALLTLMFASCVAAHAEDRKPLTIAQTVAVTNGLAVIGGCKDDSPAANKTCKLYDLKSSVRWTVALDIAAGREVGQRYNEQCDAIAQSLGGQRCGIFDPPPVTDLAAIEKQKKAIAEFNKQVNDLLATPSGVTMGRIKKADLKLDDNNYPADALSMILPIVDE